MKKHGPPPCGMNNVGSRLMAFTGVYPADLSVAGCPANVNQASTRYFKRPLRCYALTLTFDPAAFGVCEPLVCRYDAAPALVAVVAAAFAVLVLAVGALSPSLSTVAAAVVGGGGGG